MPGNEIHKLDASAETLNDFRFGQRRQSVVAAFDVDIRFDFGDEIFGSRLAEKNHVVDSLQAEQNFCAVELIVNRSRIAFESSDGFIGVEPDNQHVTEIFCRRQVANVPRVNYVEAAVREDDFFILPSQFVAKVRGVVSVNQHYLARSKVAMSSVALTVLVPSFRTAMPAA